MSDLKNRIKDILLRDQILSSEGFEQVLEEQRNTGEELGSILISMGLVNEDQLASLFSEGLDLPLINISRLKIDPSVIKLIPLETLKKFNILPISHLGENLSLAMADPLNIFAIDNVKELTGLNITPLIARAEDIEMALSKYGDKERRSERAFDEILKDIRGDNDDLEVINDLSQGAGEEANYLSEDTPIIKLTNTIISQAVYAKASDVFIEPMAKSLRVRYRIDGVLREIDRLAKVLHFPIISRLKVISNLDISEHRLPQDGRFRMVLEEGHEVDFRVSVLPTTFGEKIVLRLLDKDLEVVNIQKLGLDQANFDKIEMCGQRPHGMILACGPTGSGKTTTLYSIMRHIDSPEKNIVTVEDPVEYQMKGFNQVNIRYEVGLTFPSTLRSILRQDPDVILIGEIRDSETLDIGVKAALTGHLVLSSLHTTTAAGSIVRMMNMGIEPFLICSAVNCFIAQRLLRRICPNCKEQYIVPDEVIKKTGIKNVLPEKDRKFYRGKGCSKCLKSGYAGRVGIHEVMVLTPGLKRKILSRASEIEIHAAAREEGMKTMREDALVKAAQGLTTLEEVVRVTAADETVKVDKE